MIFVCVLCPVIAIFAFAAFIAFRFLLVFHNSRFQQSPSSVIFPQILAFKLITFRSRALLAWLTGAETRAVVG